MITYPTTQNSTDPSNEALANMVSCQGCHANAKKTKNLSASSRYWKGYWHILVTSRKCPRREYISLIVLMSHTFTNWSLEALMIQLPMWFQDTFVTVFLWPWSVEMFLIKNTHTLRNSEGKCTTNPVNLTFQYEGTRISWDYLCCQLPAKLCVGAKKQTSHPNGDLDTTISIQCKCCSMDGHP